jgi:hypothetical protein
VIGCRIKKAENATKINKTEEILHDLPAANPMSKGDKRKTQEPWSVGRAIYRRKYFFMMNAQPGSYQIMDI